MQSSSGCGYRWELQGGGYAGLSRQAVIRKNLQFTTRSALFRTTLRA